VLAALSPLGASGLVWLAANLVDPGIESASSMRFSLLVVGAAVVLSVAALIRARSWAHRALSLIGLVGNLVVLAFVMAHVNARQLLALGRPEIFRLLRGFS
jgi:hypothetical protein